MEWYSVKILQCRKRLGLKEIEAPSIEVAESALIEILCDYLNSNFYALEEVLKRSVYVYKGTHSRKLLLFFQIASNGEPEKFSLEISRKVAIN